MFTRIANPSRKDLLIALAAPALLAGMLVPLSAPSRAASLNHPADGMTYVYFGPGGRSSTMSGSMDDLDFARSLRSGDEALLYVRLNGRAYVIRDRALLREVDAIFEPQRRLGNQQAALGSRQAELGREQAALGLQQASLGGRQARATPVQAAELGRRQGELGRQQNALGERQNALGRQQNDLGRQQQIASREADRRLRALVADAVRRGLAQPAG